MKSWFDENWEIRDEKGCIFKGNQDEMLLAWNINYLNNKNFKEVYGHSYRKKKWKIKEWHGNLELVQILDRTNSEEIGIRKWNAKFTGKF